MNDQKLIKKIFNLACYDFNNNSTNLMTITGLQAVLATIFFFILCFITSDYTVSSWAWSPNIAFDLIHKLSNLFSSESLRLIFIAVCFVTASGVALFPLIVIQNCLDLAFDSAMRGFSIGSIVFSYVGMMIICNGLIFGTISLFSGRAVFSILSLMQTDSVVGIFFVRLFILILISLFLYFMQIVYFLSMHVLEYKVGILQSCKDILKMISENLLFLCKVLLLQSLITSFIVAVFYVCSPIVIKFFVRVIVWPFNVLQLSIAPIFTYMITNFFYIWAYLLLYAWICLVTAHVYRQLICPSVEHVSCDSCQK